MERIHHRTAIALVIAMAAIGAMSTDMYLPSAPTMRDAFGTTDRQIQLTMSAFFFGTATSHFFVGLFSDRFGRRIPTLAGLATYFAATVGILVVPNIEAVIALRFVQGAGAAVGGVLGVLIVNDLFQEKAAARWMGHRASAVTLAFVFAPLIGSWLEISFGWTAAFVLMAAFGGSLCVVAWFVLRETHTVTDLNSLRLDRVVSNVATLITDRRFLGCLVAPPLMFGGFFAFLTVAPFLYIEQLGLSPGLLGVVFLFHSGGFLIGVQVARRLNERHGLDRVTFFGFLIGVLATGVMLVLVAGIGTSIAAVTGPMAIMMFGLGFVNPNVTVRGVRLYPRVAGLASATMGTALLGSAALYSWLIGLFSTQSAMPLAIIAFISSLLAFGIATRTLENKM